jgi:uncharacterized protein (TIGR04255 family)
MARHEQYPRSPLVYVACEIQFPIVPKANGADAFEALTETFADRFPVPEQEERALLVSPSEAMHRQKLSRFVSRDRVTSVSVAQAALTIETTDYPGWEGFVERIHHAVGVVGRTLSVAGVTRVGLRYVNEVRVPGPVDAISDWGRWIRRSLIEPATSIPVTDPGVFQAVVQSRAAQRPDGEHSAGPALTVRYGALDGPGVVSDEPLKKVRQRGSGPYFLIDTDSFEAMSNLPTFADATLAPVLEALHEPLDYVFESMITDELRAELRKGN